MQIFQEIARVLHIEPERLERESIKSFLEKDLKSVDVEIYKIANKHGIKSIFELDEKLKRGELTEEKMLDDFMQLDFLESKRDELLKAMGKLKRGFYRGSTGIHEFCKGEAPGRRTINSTIKDSSPSPKIIRRERNFKDF